MCCCAVFPSAAAAGRCQAFVERSLRGLRVFNTQWCGDDVRVRFRESGMDPDHTDAMRGVGLNDGDRLGNTDLYPMVWCDSRN